MSASLNTGEKRRWQNCSDSQFTCNISESSTLGSCWAVLPHSRGKPSPVCDSRVGTRLLLIKVRQGVSLHIPEIQQTSSSYLCLLRRPLCVYWLGTTRHWELSSKCRFTKGCAGGGKVGMVQAVWICWCLLLLCLIPDRCCRTWKTEVSSLGLCLTLGAFNS